MTPWPHRTCGRAGLLVVAALAQGCIATSHQGEDRASPPLVAFSLRRAEAILRAGHPADTSPVDLGHIRRLIAVVSDHAGHDIVLVGHKGESGPYMRLDDLVVAMRATRLNQWPLVSIDPTPETAMTGLQRVRMEGGIDDTQFGKDLLAVDVWLKRSALGTLDVSLVSYFDLRAKVAEADPSRSDGASRLWFRILNGRVEEREGIFALHNLHVGVQTEQVSASNSKEAPGRDVAAQEFGDALTRSFDRLAGRFPEVDRLRSLYESVAAAEAIKKESSADVSYWLDQYSIPAVPTPRDFMLETRRAALQTKWGAQTLRISGGVQLKALVVRLQDGDVTALRDAVLLSRPGPQSLTWPVPLEGWDLEGGRAMPTIPPVLAEKLGSRLQWEVRALPASPNRSPETPLYAPNSLAGDGSIMRVPVSGPSAVRNVDASKATAGTIRDRGGVSADIQLTGDDFGGTPLPK